MNGARQYDVGGPQTGGAAADEPAGGPAVKIGRCPRGLWHWTIYRGPRAVVSWGGFASRAAAEAGAKRALASRHRDFETLVNNSPDVPQGTPRAGRG